MKHKTIAIDKTKKVFRRKYKQPLFCVVFLLLVTFFTAAAQVNEAPVIITNDVGGFQENENDIVLNVQAIDDSDSEQGGGLSYTFIEGLNSEDNSLFEIHPQFGEIFFNASPDFENPSDADADNVYEIRIQVCDSEMACDTQEILIIVIDLAEYVDIGCDELFYDFLTIEPSTNPDFASTLFRVNIHADIREKILDTEIPIRSLSFNENGSQIYAIGDSAEYAGKLYSLTNGDLSGFNLLADLAVLNPTLLGRQGYSSGTFQNEQLYFFMDDPQLRNKLFAITFDVLGTPTGVVEIADIPDLALPVQNAVSAHVDITFSADGTLYGMDWFVNSNNINTANQRTQRLWKYDLSNNVFTMIRESVRFYNHDFVQSYAAQEELDFYGIGISAEAGLYGIDFTGDLYAINTNSGAVVPFYEDYTKGVPVTDGDWSKFNCDLFSSNVCIGDSTTGDDDNDFICNDLDNCPTTPNNNQADCDGDGIGDVCESDIDNDGIPDDCDTCFGDNSTGDADGDGICGDSDNCPDEPNNTQTDCDGDGIGDVCESDIDNDGIPDDCDTCFGDNSTGDADGDGICGDLDNCPDEPNNTQTDCDGDGIGDVCESDIDNDGIPDDCDTCFGDNSTGDADGDGICGDSDNCPDEPNNTQTDCDGDGIGDVCESDIDNDGIPDDCDTCFGDNSTGDVDGDGICGDLDNCPDEPNNMQTDCDGDGIGDVCESDIDNDGIPDDCDTCFGTGADSDGDGYCDDIDNCVNIANPDQADCDGDGEADVCESDADNDGIPDDCDICFGNNATGDTDGDGFCDDSDNCSTNVNTGQADCDGDGVGDECELDEDNDGIPNDCDLCFGNNATGDTDGDGICDDLDNCNTTVNPDQSDCDGDGIGDLCESDDDGDGVPNDCDICIGTGADTDGDGYCDDNDNCVDVPNPDQADCDGDGVADVCEPDEDGDGIPNDCDTCIGDNATGDTDGDGYCDNLDNCNTIVNPDQADCDGDGIGDLCESDDDTDGIPNDCDLCFGDNTTGDADADGICDNLDNCVDVPNPDQADCDGDGEADVCESDIDNDTIPDDCDICIGDNATGDTDGDGICDDLDNCNTTVNTDQSDCDGDGIGDLCESDDDGDGIPNDCDPIVGCNGYTASATLVGGGCVAPGEFAQLQAVIESGDLNPASYSFSWTGPNNYFTTAQNPIIYNLNTDKAGTYTVTITSLADNCTTILTVDLPVSIAPEQPLIASQPSVVCIGGELIIYVTSGNDMPLPVVDHYEWSGPLGTTSSGAYPATAEIIIDDFQAFQEGVYQVVVTYNGCPSLPSEPLGVFAASIVNPPAVESEITLCKGETFQLQTSTQADQYFWTGPNGFSSSLQNPIVSNNVNVLFEGEYTLVVTNNGCSSPGSIVDLTVGVTPDEPVLQPVATLCEGEDLMLTTNEIPGATYQWISPSNSPNGFFGSLSNPNNVVWTTSPTTTISEVANSVWYEGGLWSVQAVGAEGCVSDVSLPVLVTISSVPEVAFASNGGDVCEGEEVTLFATTVAGATYRWYDGDPAASPPGTLIATTKNASISGLEPGDYTFFVETKIGDCSSEEYGQTELTVYPKPILANITNTGPYCVGSTILLQAPAILGATYYWEGPAGFQSGLQNPEVLNAQMMNAGFYTLYVTINGCESELLSTNVVINPAPSSAEINSNGPVCTGEDLLLFGPTLSGLNPTYSWSGPNGFSSALQNPIIPSVSASNGGLYSLSVSIFGCNTIVTDVSEISVVDIPSQPDISSNATAASPICVGGNIQLSTPFLPGATYSWSGPNGFTSTAASPLIPNVSLADAGTYFLIVSAGNCVSEMVTTNVVINNEITVPVALGNGPVCEGEEVILSVANPVAGANYEWFDSLGNVSIGFGEELLLENADASDAGTYYVVATIGNCISDPSMSTSAGEDSFIEIEIETFSSNVVWLGNTVYSCEDTVTISALPLNGGTGEWTWASPSSTAVIHYPNREKTFVSGLLEGDNKIVWTIYSGACGFTSTDTLLIEWAKEPPRVIGESYIVPYNESLNDIDFSFNDVPNTEAYEITILSSPNFGKLEQQDNGLWTYEPNTGFAGQDEVRYEICHQFCTDKCGEAVAIFEVGEAAPCQVPTVITPNGDGLNVQFIIPCIPNNPGSSLSIFNRWGAEVYFNENYKNDWEGTFEGGDLPSGTYFYIIVLNDGNGTKMSGNVFVER